MSELKTEEEKAAEQRRGPAAARRGGPPHLQIGVPTEKSQDFVPSAKRVLRLLHPERFIVWTVVALAVASVALSAIGPKILGAATDLIFAGVFGKQIPAGVTQQQAAEALRARGEDSLADMLAAMDHVVPGQGIDFTALAEVLLFVLALYIVAALLQWMQGRMLTVAVNRTIYRLRRDVEDKLNRLALPYFDGQPRGELLSRVTNDIDNVAQSLQQTLSQLLTSLLTVVAMIAMMVWISPLLALIALVTIPITMVVTAMIGKRSQKHFVQQWKSTGEVNGVVEETYTGHELVKVFGRQQEADRLFAVRNDALYHASFRAQFISGIIMPTMMFIGNLNYVVIAVVGGLRVASGTMSLGDVQAFIQYSRQFTQPLTQVASMANLMQSGVASAERVFAVLDAPEQEPDTAHPATIEDPRGRVAFEDVTFSYRDDTPLIENLDLIVEPGQTVAIVGPTGAGKTTLVNLVLRFYELKGGRITLDGVDITAAHPPRPALADRHGPAGHLAVRRHDPREHRLRPARRDRRGGPRGRPGDLRRPLRALAARRLRHGAQRRGRQHQRRRAPAHHHRPGVPRRTVAAHPRRGDVVGRHPHRAARAARDVGPALGPHELRHRPPTLDDPGCRPHPRHGGRTHRRARLARRAALCRRRFRQAVRRPVPGRRDRPRRRAGRPTSWRPELVRPLGR